MKKFSVFLLLLFFTTIMYSQKGILTGKVFDYQTKEILPYAEVSLQSVQNKNNVLGVITDEKGRFSLKNILMGDYVLKISFIGYEAITKDVKIQSSKLDLGNIYLKLLTENLSEIVLEAERSAFTYGVDKKIINASSFPDANTAIDLLTNIPSLQVSVDGKITYREKGTFRVYINGIAVKDGQERLRTLDTSQIDKIEIITNPSAKYSAEGTAGIIRVLLKKNRLEGYSISASAELNTLGTNRYNFFIDKKYKRGGWYISGNFRDNRWAKRDAHTMKDIQTDAQIFQIEQKEDFIGKFRSAFIDFGFNYDLTDRDYIDISVNFDPIIRKEFKPTHTQTRERVFDSKRNLLSQQQFQLNNYYQFTYQTLGSNVEYTHFFNEDKTHSLKLNSGIDFFLKSSESLTKNERIDKTGSVVFGNRNFEKNEVFTSTDIDYEVALSEKSSLEAGIGVETDKIPEIEYENGIFKGDVIVVQNTEVPYNQTLNYEQNIYAGYTSFKSSFGKFEYKFGLRVENTKRNIAYSYKDATGYHTNIYNKNFVDWFPSVHLLYSFSESNQITANYSRRIFRPNYSALIPAFVLDNKYTYSTGNSNLSFSYTDSYEIGIKKSWDKDFISMEVFAHNQHNIIDGYFRPYRDNILLVTQENVGKSWSIGSELMAGVDIFKWWNINSSLTSFYMTQKNKIDSIDNNFSLWIYSGKLNNTFKIPYNFEAKFNVAYISDIKSLQSEREAYWETSASITKSFQDKRWQLAFFCSNVLDSYRFTNEMKGEKFHIKTENYYYPDVGFSIRYMFNNQK